MASDLVEIGKEVLKLAVRARYSFSLWVVSLIILVVPVPSFLRLDVFRQDYGQYIGLVCLTMFVVWAVEVGLMGWEAVEARFAARRGESKILKQLDSLNSREAHLLVIAVSKKVQSVNWREDAVEISSLAAKGMLELVPYKSNGGTKPCTIPRFVWEEINKPKILENLQALDKERSG